MKSCGSCTNPAPLDWMGTEGSTEANTGVQCDQQGWGCPHGLFPHPTLCPPPQV